MATPGPTAKGTWGVRDSTGAANRIDSSGRHPGHVSNVTSRPGGGGAARAKTIPVPTIREFYSELLQFTGGGYAAGPSAQAAASHRAEPRMTVTAYFAASQ